MFPGALYITAAKGKQSSGYQLLHPLKGLHVRRNYHSHTDYKEISIQQKVPRKKKGDSSNWRQEMLTTMRT